MWAVAYPSIYWLGISIGGEELFPRVRFTAVPYSIRSGTSGDLECSGCVSEDEIGFSVVTGVVAGQGLEKSSQGGEVTLSISGSYRLPQNCSNGQVAKWNGSGWVCSDDADSGGDITAVNAGTGLTGGGTSGDVTLSLNTSYMDSNYWKLGGNSTSSTGVLGTTSNQPLEIHVNNQRALKIEPNAASPNIIGGYSGNGVTNGVVGATIGGGGASGTVNQVTDSFGTVGGGLGNRAGNDDEDTTNAYYATVSGGYHNTVSGHYSFAAGWRAKAQHQGTFVWADSTNADFASQRQDRFRVRANGGARFDVNSGSWVEIYNDGSDLINTSTGAHLTVGGTWTNASDRNAKENFQPVDPQEVLERVAGLPISTWNYKAQDPSIRHMGPMAQDFYAAFGLGEDDKHIATVDADGVALAAIQALYRMVKRQGRLIEELRRRLKVQEAELERLRRRLSVMEAALGPGILASSE